MNERFREWLREPRRRLRFAWILFYGSLVGWPLTHAMMLVTKPEGATSWVFHLLLALSWLSVTLTALTFVSTADVRRAQEEES